MLEQQLLEEENEREWPLTILGHEQSLAAGHWLQMYTGPISALYSSPYARALQTAANLGLPLEPITDERLREREWGEYEVGHYDSTEYIRDLYRCSSFDWKTRFPNAESISDLVAGSRDFLSELVAKETGQVVLVTHGGRMQAIEFALEGRIVDRRLTNCCIVHYQLSEGNRRVRVVYPAQTELRGSEWEHIRVPILA